MKEKKIYMKTVQECCNYLYSKTNQPVDYKTLITYIKNNLDAILLNQQKDYYSDEFIAKINNTPISLDDLTSPIMKINLEDSSLIPLSKEIFAFKHLNRLKSDIHIHNCVEVDFVIKGNATLLFEKETIELKTGYACIISPQSKHSIIVDKNAFVINIFIRNKSLQNILDLNEEFDIISKFIYNIIINKYSTPNYLLFKTTDNETMYEALKQIVIESHIHQDKYSSVIALSWLKIFIYNVLRSFNQSSLYLPLADAYKTLYEIINYTEKNYNQVSLSLLAEKFHYNEAYLSSLIKKNFGLSFSNILTNIKMTHAKTYLIHTNMKISEISIKVGYNSIDHFIRIFTKINGITPGKYRRKYTSQ